MRKNHIQSSVQEKQVWELSGRFLSGLTRSDTEKQNLKRTVNFSGKIPKIRTQPEGQSVKRHLSGRMAKADMEEKAAKETDAV